MEEGVMDKLEGYPLSQFGTFEDPRVLIERLTQSAILCGSPREFFSDLRPSYVPPPGEDDDLRPIDIVYGIYDPVKRSVHIFIRSIADDATTLYSCKPSTLVKIVRLHEYGHAFVHLATDVLRIERQLLQYGSGKETNWASFLSRRTKTFKSLDSRCHELLAQEITWACLKNIGDELESQKLTETFEKLETRQAAHYRLSPDVKKNCPHAQWPLILRAAQGTMGRKRGEGFSMFEGLVALIEQTAV